MEYAEVRDNIVDRNLTFSHHRVLSVFRLVKAFKISNKDDSRLEKLLLDFFFTFAASKG